MTSVLNGSVDVFSTGVGEIVEQVRAGNIKVLGITAEERLEGEVLSEFPTAIEQGIDEVSSTGAVSSVHRTWTKQQLITMKRNSKS